jgi:hypothetical protein
MVFLAIRIENALMMTMDRPRHSHLSEDHRPAVLRGSRDAMRCGLHFLHRVFGLWNHFRQPVDGFAQGAQLMTERPPK